MDGEIAGRGLARDTLVLQCHASYCEVCGVLEGTKHVKR